MLHEQALKLAVSTENKKGSTTPATWVGKWKNQMGSEMELEVSGSDLSGTYISADSSGGNPITGVLKGNAYEDLISFLVLWPGGSMTAWVGQLVDDTGTPRIKTLWHLVTDVKDPDEPKRLWTSTLAGADEFTR